MGSDDNKPDGNIETPPVVIAPSEPKETSLPAIAAKADDLEEIKKSVEDAASVSGGLWLSYLFVPARSTRNCITRWSLGTSSSTMRSLWCARTLK
jgi:hypothetical protein